MSERDRRRYPRLEEEMSVDLLNMGDDPSVSPYEAIVPAKAMDVSRAGMRLKAGYNVPVGSLLSLITYYKGYESVCLCEVVWKTEGLKERMYGVFIREWSKLDRGLAARLSSMECLEPLPLRRAA